MLYFWFNVGLYTFLTDFEDRRYFASVHNAVYFAVVVLRHQKP